MWLWSARVRWRFGVERAGQGGVPGHADRPAPVQHLPAAALPSRHRRPERRRRHLLAALLRGQARRRPVPPRRGRRHRPRGQGGHLRRRRQDRLRLPGHRQRHHDQPLRHPRRGRVHDVDVHAGRGAEGARHDLRQHGDHRGPLRPEHRRLHRRRRRRRRDRRRDGRPAGRAQERGAALAPTPSSTRRRCTSCWSRWARTCWPRSTTRCASTRSQELIKRGVDVRLKTAISEVHADRVDFKDGDSMPVDLVIWAAGVSGNPTLRDWGIPIGRAGRIEVNADLRVLGEENIFAIGDSSLIVDNPLPQLAQPAIQTRQVRGQADRPAAPRPADREVRVPRQGHHGHDRPWRRRAADAVRAQAQGRHRLARLDRPAHRLPAGRPQPDPDPAQPHVALRRPAPHQRHRGRRDGDSEADGSIREQ